MKSIKKLGITVQNDRTGQRTIFREEIWQLPKRFRFLKELAVQTFDLPDGGQGRWESVHEKGATILVAALTGRGDLILVKLFRLPVHSVCLELPGGATKVGESPGQTAKRELLEETGYATDDEILPFLLPGSLYNGGTSAEFRLFAALNCYKAARPKRDAVEKYAGIRTVIMSPRVILENIREGKSGCDHYDPLLSVALITLHARGMISLAS